MICLRENVIEVLALCRRVIRTSAPRIAAPPPVRRAQPPRNRGVGETEVAALAVHDAHVQPVLVRRRRCRPTRVTAAVIRPPAYRRHRPGYVLRHVVPLRCSPVLVIASELFLASYFRADLFRPRRRRIGRNVAAL